MVPGGTDTTAFWRTFNARDCSCFASESCSGTVPFPVRIILENRYFRGYQAAFSVRAGSVSHSLNGSER